jgi:hypothetical protein
MSVERRCLGCGELLPPKHLRVQLAPPDSRWREVRVHDAYCLQDWLDEEIHDITHGIKGDVFKDVAELGDAARPR